MTVVEPDEYYKLDRLTTTVGGILSTLTGDCGRYVTSQMASVNDHYDLVLLTLGGNDARFATIGAQCLAGFEYSDADSCAAALDAADGFVSDEQSTVTRFA